jgi:hypothetical protein
VECVRAGKEVDVFGEEVEWPEDGAEGVAF